MKHALNFAETGHLCLCTLHANNANQALDRIMNFFPAEMHEQIWMDLSLNLKAIIAQQLIPAVDGKRAAATEILVNTPMIADLVRNGSVPEIKEAMGRASEQGMQTFDKCLFNLYQEGKISLNDAMAHADSANNVRLMVKLAKDGELDDSSASATWVVSEEDDV